MKQNHYKSALILPIFILLVSSCMTTKITNVKKTYGEKLPYQNLECSTTELEEVDIFFETDSINFNYEEIGFVTAYATMDIADSLILKRLQYNSYSLCGNGIINITSSQSIKDGLSVKEFKGVSVIIEKDSEYYDKYPFEADYSFYNFSINDIETSEEKITIIGVIGYVSAATLGIIGIIFRNQDKNEEEYDNGI